MPKAPKIHVSKRSVFGKRKSVYDARGQLETGAYAGHSYDVTGLESEKAARAAALALVVYKAAQGTLFGSRCTLEPTDVGCWYLTLPSGCGMAFAASDLRAAFLRIEHEYRDHAGVQAFCAGVRDGWTTMGERLHDVA
jgi:hypothetical protein